ncbi:MAG: tRNA lysidine(34) synthetase TilS [Propioniciclava sp.]|uniref:tRNA lysidine(34) synthetase TilS n=1 Tax=Propioniciclava sp. TaxID=2038686 RepID=UPI0039E4C5EC
MARRALGAATLAVVQAVETLACEPWLVACSGGADSLALAWAARHVASRRGTPVRALVVDHGLQPGSDAVAAAVRARLAGFGLEASVAAVTVPEGRAGPEASAREARYQALSDAISPGESVLLGHTRDDQAETVLLGLARGAGLAALSGMRAERGPFRRPLLDLPRTTTADACAELGLEPWHDPMNADRRYARVRVREVVLPVLEAELGPGIRDALARSARLLGETHSLIAVLADETEPGCEADCRHLAGLAPGVRRQLILEWLRDQGVRDVATVHVDAVERLVMAWRGQKGVDVPGGRVSRRDGRLYVTLR